MDPTNPLGASNAAEISQLHASTYALPTSQGQISEKLNQAQDEQAAAKAAAAQAKQREADLSNPSKYRTVPKKDGGFDYFAPDGSQIDIATLTHRTGTKPSDWIKDSTNPIDIQYQADQKNLQQFMNAVVTKDKTIINQYTKADPNLKKYTSGRGGVQNLLNDFYKNYQRYYVPESWGVAPGNPNVRANITGKAASYNTGSDTSNTVGGV